MDHYLLFTSFLVVLLSIYIAPNHLLLSLSRNTWHILPPFLSSQSSQWPTLKLQNNFQEYCTTREALNTHTWCFRPLFSPLDKRLQGPLNQHTHLCFSMLFFPQNFSRCQSCCSVSLLLLDTNTADLFFASAKS